MAIVEGNLLRGKLGDKIYSIDPVTKKQMVRDAPKKVRNPKTDAQQKHRNAFVEIVRLSSYMTEAHSIGLHHHAVREHKRTYADFRSLNKKCFTKEGLIDYPNITLSYGSIAQVMFTAAQLDEAHILHLTYDPCLGASHSRPDDNLFLYAYCPAFNTGQLYDPVPRQAGSFSIELPSEWPSDDVHLYAFLVNNKRSSSRTIYVTMDKTE